MNNPVLVEVLRGDVVESRHRGAIVVVDADGPRAHSSIWSCQYAADDTIAAVATAIRAKPINLAERRSFSSSCWRRSEL